MANDGFSQHGNENFEQESKIMASGLFEATADVQTTLPVGTNPISLSDREQQVLFGIADGMSNREIAESMGIGIKTVESYRARLVAKLRLRTRTELADYANTRFQRKNRTESE
jgi:DNA-binding NarL/FixJ family response regulator